MTQTVTGLFDRYMDAAAAVRELEAAGIPHVAPFYQVATRLE